MTTTKNPPQQYLETFIQKYTQRTQTSKNLAQKNRQILADKTSIGIKFTPEIKELCYPIAVEKSNGSRLWDIDGNEYIDILMGLGTNLFGHNPPFIQTAITEQLQRGMHIGVQNTIAGEVAQLISELTGAERVTFSNTGTEAVMTAVRIARAATKRSKIVIFTNSYHGHFDAVLVRATMTEYAKKAALRVMAAKSGSFLGRLLQPIQAGLAANLNPKAVPAAPGIPPSAADDVLILEYGNEHSLNLIRKHRQEIAAVLVEPVQSRFPELQPREFLQHLRQITQELGIVLIFDEMVTGFRIHPGGAQAHFGLKADITTYSKIVGGGLPLSVIAGKASYMNYIDGGQWQFGDDSAPQVTTTFFAGTFCKHPLALAAAHATLQHLKTSGIALHQDLNERTTQLVSDLNADLTQQDIAIKFTSFGSFFAVATSQSAVSPMAMNLLSYHLIEKGIHLRQGDKGGFLSTAHTDEDINLIKKAFIESIKELQTQGLINK
ncbi:aspartate aminotransferase family protein [Nodularia spumigena CS-586/05]|uniref:Polyketide synthase n=1 Tax=Nodularia spumigena CENA596 TaxID=1819295 RepID=A0A166JSD0_NODSP|nr:aspartate aminotransferase family protein [Nodularia spumigena]KZL50072.1 polyketide synthase [Nodularia spumigena CENA596]MDB9345132.1 aspartate aminotransferase family protein [Nodularia spumigena CS-588/06]MDB9369917.1 aspartate aminotransferase family protein [Nodularia spumigena CS-586/05]